MPGRESAGAFFRRRAAVRTARALIPATGDVNDLIDALAQRRGRPIRILDMPLSGTPSGAWIPTSSADYLVYPTGASSTRRVAALCHELGHILLRHQPGFHGLAAEPLLQALAPRLAPHAALRMLLRDGYTDAEEAGAERLGTILSAALEDRSRLAAWTASSRLSTRLR